MSDLRDTTTLGEIGGTHSGITELDLTASTAYTLTALQNVISAVMIAERQAPSGINIHVHTPSIAQDVPGTREEPVYDASAQADIQGNIIPGFNKDHQHFLFYGLGSRRGVKNAKSFLRWMVPYLSSLEEVIAFRRLWRAQRLRLGPKQVFLRSSWANIAFSSAGIAKLVGKEQVDAFGDRSFQQGMAARASHLGDPTDPKAAGHVSNWVVGSRENESDFVLIVASDGPSMLQEMVDLIKGQAQTEGLKLLFEQRGGTLPGNLRGHEHFGFRDGISQPGIRGKLSTAPGDYITPRYLHDRTDDRRLYFSKPGQLLLWPGQILLGEQRQSTEHLYVSTPAPVRNFPEWAKRGSYLVIRRLHQDVPKFWQFVTEVADRLGIDGTKIASMMVGRWPSGAPIVRTPETDNPLLAADEFANNHFLFDDATRPSNLDLTQIPGYPGDVFSDAKEDFLARVCPHFAHIRKMNPRESVTDLGKPEDNLAHMILRRGIPYGPPLFGHKRLTKRLAEQDRGLMFLCYASTIEDQFEFLQRRWANASIQPNFGGHDPIIGQSEEEAERQRFMDFPTSDGDSIRIKFANDWVTPTGGGYFFAPTIGAVRDVLAA